MLYILRISGEKYFEWVRMYYGWAIGVSKNYFRSQDRKRAPLSASEMVLLIIKFCIEKVRGKGGGIFIIIKAISSNGKS